MNYSLELREAIEAPSIPEQVSFLDTLDEHVTTAVHTGFFTEEVMEAAWVSILRESGFEEGDEGDVVEAIDEWLDEEIDLFERKAGVSSARRQKAMRFAKGTAKRAGRSLGKEIKKQARKPLIGLGKKASKRIAGIKTKTKTGKMLKHAAAGAVRQIAKNPGKAKEVLKKSAKRAGKKLVKSAVKKGMKMVFGKWLKSEHIETLEERKSSKRAEVERAYAKRGTIRMRPINPREYPPIRGMEGPFQFRDGRILYYDPREGRYYDRKSDMYLSRDDIPEDVQAMGDELEELDEGMGSYRDRWGNVWTDEGGPRKPRGGSTPKRSMELVDRVAKTLGGRVKWSTNPMQEYAEGTLKLGRNSVRFMLSPGMFTFKTMQGGRTVKHREFMPTMVKENDIIQFVKVDLGMET